MGGVILPVCRAVVAATAVLVVLGGCTGTTPADAPRATPTPAASEPLASPAAQTPGTTAPAPTARPTSVGSTSPVPRSTTPTARPLTPRALPPVEAARRFASAAAVTTEIVGADRVLAASGTTAAQFAAAARRRKLAVRELVRTPAWREPVITAVGPKSRAKVRADVSAGDELNLLNRPRQELPNWRIVRAEPPGQLLGHYRKAERTTGIHWSYLAAINLVETNMGRIHGLSTAGARGPMQFMPGTWAEVGRGDIDDPHDSIQAAARYLVRRGGLRSIAKGLRGYNNSARYVTAVLVYAEQMRLDPTAFREYYEWPVVYPLATGDVVLNLGFAGSPR